MPLYECSKCHAVENTALTNFWWDHIHDGKPALCSECDPEIGKWHGKFDKITAEEYAAKYPDSPIQFRPTPKSETSTDSTPHQNPKSDNLVKCPTD